MLLNLILRDACDRGAVEYDFLGADDEWKFDWTSEARDHDWLLCDAFYIRLSDFLEVLPSAAQRAKQKTRTLETRRRHTSSRESAQRALFPVATPAKNKVDFAAFYPDARKFSSKSPKCKEPFKAGKVET
jgi:hypothetical protein